MLILCNKSLRAKDLHSLSGKVLIIEQHSLSVVLCVCHPYYTALFYKCHMLLTYLPCD